MLTIGLINIAIGMLTAGFASRLKLSQSDAEGYTAAFFVTGCIVAGMALPSI